MCDVCFKDIFFVSLYLPSVTNDSDRDCIMQVLSEIQDVLQMYPNHSIICGADLNVNLDSEGEAATLINNFMLHNNIVLGSKVHSSQDLINYTYCHNTLGHFSYIDYFLVSSDIVYKIQKFDIIDDALNLSDHNPIRLETGLSFDVSNEGREAASVPSYSTLRWDCYN